MLSQKGSHQTYMKTCSQLCSRRPKTDPTQHFGRHGNESYTALGYLPDDFHESVSHSLDYAYSDFALLPLPSNWVRQKQPLGILLPASPTEHCMMPKQAL